MALLENSKYKIKFRDTLQNSITAHTTHKQLESAAGYVKYKKVNRKAKRVSQSQAAANPHTKKKRRKTKSTLAK